MLEMLVTAVLCAIVAVSGFELLKTQKIALFISKRLLNLPENSYFKQLFLTELKKQIETTLLFPRPTDSVLSRHYDALVEAELSNLLSK